jgi:hypothetical protein
MLVAFVSCTVRSTPYEPCTDNLLPLMAEMMPSAKLGSGTVGSIDLVGAANAASASKPPSALAPTIAAPPTAAAVRKLRRSTGMRGVFMTASLLVNMDRQHAGRQAAKDGERGWRQIEDPVVLAVRAAASLLASRI